MSKPDPSLPAEDHGDGRAANAEFGCNIALQHIRAKPSYLADIIFHKARHSVVLSARARPMPNPIHLISRRRLPRQVPLRHAAFVAFPTRMRSLMKLGRGGTMDKLANDARNLLWASIAAHSRAPFVVSGERPNQAFVALVGQNGIEDKPQRFSVLGSAAKRITMGTPKIPVGATPSAPLRRLAATGNRAYSGSSHFSLLTGCLVRARRGGETPGGFAIRTLSRALTQRVPA